MCLLICIQQASVDGSGRNDRSDSDWVVMGAVVVLAVSLVVMLVAMLVLVLAAKIVVKVIVVFW